MDGQNFQNNQDNQNNQNYQYNLNGQGGQPDPYAQNNQYTQSTYNDPYGSNTQYTSTQDGSSSYYQDNSAYSPTAYGQPYEAPKQETPTLAVVSLVMGIASIVLSCCCGVGILFAIAGIIMAIMSNKNAKSGLATAGLICSIVGVVFSVIVFLYFMLVGVAASM